MRYRTSYNTKFSNFYIYLNNIRKQIEYLKLENYNLDQEDLKISNLINLIETIISDLEDYLEEKETENER